MPRVNTIALLLVAAWLLLDAASARAQFGDQPGAPEIGVNVGYANISLGSSSAINDEGALRFEPSASIAPIPKLQQLRIGADLGVSLVLDNSTQTIISHNGQVIVAGSSDVPLWLLEPELTLSWRQSFGSDQKFFIEPGIAGGGAFGFLDLHDHNTGISYSADSSTGYGRVFLRAGARAGTGIFGIQGSYLQGARLDFGGNAAGDLREYYIGFFGAVRF